MVNNKNINFKKLIKINFLIVITIFIIIIISYILLYSFNVKRTLLLLHNLITLIILFTYIVFLLKKFKSYYINIKDYNKILIDIFKTSLVILNNFYSYYDNTFVMIKDIFSNNHDNNVLSDLQLLLKQEILKHIDKCIDILSNDSFFYKRTQEFIDLLDKFKSFNIEINNFNENIENSKKFIQKDLVDRFATYKNKDFFHKVIVEFNYYTEIIAKFIIAYVDNTKNLAGHFSEQILEMRKNIAFFIQNIQKWKNDFFNKNSDINFDKVIKSYELQNEQLSTIYKNIDDNYINFDQKLNMISNLVENIYENISSIEDIANKINILSINASIESTRSDKSGKGFKIIASQIKSLANYTKSFITNIVSIIKNTNDVVTATSSEFKLNSERLSLNIKNNKEQLNLFYNNLHNYYNNFNKMFESVSELTSEINKHIDKFNVLIQNYDIEEQQMGNLIKIIQNFYKTHEKDLNKIISSMNNKEKEKILIDIISFIDEIATTEIENNILEKIKIKYGLISDKIKQKSEKIEFF